MRANTLQWAICHKNDINLLRCWSGQPSSGREWFLPKFCLTLPSLNRLTDIIEFSYQKFKVCVYFCNMNSFVYLELLFFVKRVDDYNINKMKLLNIWTVFDGFIWLCFGQYSSEDITVFDINRKELLTFSLKSIFIPLSSTLIFA